jgi:hypothetical protein
LLLTLDRAAGLFVLIVPLVLRADLSALARQ